MGVYIPAQAEVFTLVLAVVCIRDRAVGYIQAQAADSILVQVAAFTPDLQSMMAIGDRGALASRVYSAGSGRRNIVPVCRRYQRD